LPNQVGCSTFFFLVFFSALRFPEGSALVSMFFSLADRRVWCGRPRRSPRSSPRWFLHPLYANSGPCASFLLRHFFQDPLSFCVMTAFFFRFFWQGRGLCASSSLFFVDSAPCSRDVLFETSFHRLDCLVPQAVHRITSGPLDHSGGLAA